MTCNARQFYDPREYSHARVHTVPNRVAYRRSFLGEKAYTDVLQITSHFDSKNRGHTDICINLASHRQAIIDGDPFRRKILDMRKRL
jgi:hypothetical protein